MGIVACHWNKGDTEQCKELYPIIIDLQEKRFGDNYRKKTDISLVYVNIINLYAFSFSSPVPTALHLAFKAQHLHRNSSPPLRVLNQLCLTACQSLNDCGQKMNTEDTLNMVRLRYNYCVYVTVH